MSERGCVPIGPIPYSWINVSATRLQRRDRGRDEEERRGKEPRAPDARRTHKSGLSGAVRGSIMRVIIQVRCHSYYQRGSSRITVTPALLLNKQRGIQNGKQDAGQSDPAKRAHRPLEPLALRGRPLTGEIHYISSQKKRLMEKKDKKKERERKGEESERPS